MKTIRTIKAGGFGLVEEVEDENGTRLARKTFMPPSGLNADSLRKRFLREVKTQSNLKHPNIVPILWADLSGDSPWFVMPLADESLDDRLLDVNQIPFVDEQMWTGLLSAVEELHEMGLYHRDIKPGNILRIGDIWYLSDFGLVLPPSVATDGSRITTTALQSERYCSAQLAIDFKNPTPQDDVFALGCVLADCVQGFKPRPAHVTVSVPGRLKAVIEHATATLEENRTSDIATFRMELNDAMTAPWEEDVEMQFASTLEAIREGVATQAQWEEFIAAAEVPSSRHKLLEPLTSTMMLQLADISLPTFGRLVTLTCEWTAQSGFDFSFCDRIADRLESCFAPSTRPQKIKIILALAELGASHNRWYVMRVARKLLSDRSDAGIRRGIAIELEVTPKAKYNFHRIGQVVGNTASLWPPEILPFVQGPAPLAYG